MPRTVWLLATCVLAGGVIVLVFPREDTQSEKVVPERISGAVLPHHDLVKDVRTDFVKELSEKVHPETIILVSPNHFGTGNQDVSVYNEPLTTVHGDMLSNGEVVEALAREGFSADTKAFDFEHGIRSPLSDIARYFKDTQIVPIIIKTDVPYEVVLRLADVLASSCDNCLMIASVDFSHYQTAQVATLHDVVSLRALKMADPKYLYQEPEVDSPQALALLALWAHVKDTPAFTLVRHTNSGYVMPSTAHETTTHIMGYFSDGVVSASPLRATFILTGAEPPSGYRQHIERKEFWDRLFWGVDSVYGWGTNVVTSSHAPQMFATVTYNGVTTTLESAKRDIARAEEAGQQVIARVLRNTENGDEQRSIAHTLIDAGADVVVGNAAIPEIYTEVYNGKPIFYSLQHPDMQRQYVVSGMVDTEALRLSVSVVSATSTFDLASGTSEGDILYTPFASHRDFESEGEWFVFPK